MWYLHKTTVLASLTACYEFLDYLQRFGFISNSKNTPKPKKNYKQRNEKQAIQLND
jgi:hypothetical protein